MKLDKAQRRDKKIHKRQHGMRIIGRSIFSIFENDLKRAETILNKKKKLEELQKCL